MSLHPALIHSGRPHRASDFWRRHVLSAAGTLCALAAVLTPTDSLSREARFVLPSMVGGGFGVEMSTMLDRKFYTVVRQRFDFSCGSAALATLLHYHYGVPADETMTFNGMWENGDQASITKSGFSLLDMKRFLSARGLSTEGFKVTLDQIAKARAPGIALTVTRGYRHFVVIKGVSDRDVLVGDPSRGLIRYSRSEFEKIWDGLYFVITSAREVGQDSFNRNAQWASVGRAQPGGPLSRPVNMQDTRVAVPIPILGEF